MKLHKLLTKGLTKNVDAGDLIDALIVSADLEKFQLVLKDLYNIDLDDNTINTLKSFSSDLNLVRMLGNTRALQLYIELMPVFKESGVMEVPKSTILKILNYDYKNWSHFYRAVSTVVQFMNANLKGKSVLYSQYADKATFVVIDGDTFEEALNSLAASGVQSPKNIDDLRVIFIGRGSDC